MNIIDMYQDLYSVATQLVKENKGYEVCKHFQETYDSPIAEFTEDEIFGGCGHYCNQSKLCKGMCALFKPDKHKIDRIIEAMMPKRDEEVPF